MSDCTQGGRRTYNAPTHAPSEDRLEITVHFHGEFNPHPIVLNRLDREVDYVEVDGELYERVGDGCEYCTMDIHTSGKMAWWQGADYVDGIRSASIQADDAACEHFELWIEEIDKWNDETHVTCIPIHCCPWCGQELKEGGE